MKKDFYERLLVAKVISQVMGLPITEAFNYLKVSEDKDSSELLWLTITGDFINWGEHLLYICTGALNIMVKQPGYEPFSVTEETLESDKEYKDWYENEWKPIIASYLIKYKNVYENRLSAKITRGNTDYLKIIQESYITGVVQEYRTKEVSKLISNIRESSKRYSEKEISVMEDILYQKLPQSVQLNFKDKTQAVKGLLAAQVDIK